VTSFRPGESGRTVRLSYALVFVLALANRLIPVLRGGGLSSVLGYDDGVYYAGAVALVHGRLPYRDFLLLHPPGVLVGLAPLAALGRLTDEVIGWELARVTWMLLGCVTALLIMRSLRPVGLRASLAGGCLYAVFPGAVLVERTTLLEGLANCFLAAALAVLIPQLVATDRGSPPSTRSRPTWVPWAAVGAFLGLATTVKIWGAVPLIVVISYLAVVVGLRSAALVAVASALSIGAVCLPFFAAAPSAMWRMVVLNQLGRPRQDGSPVERFAEILTMDHLPAGWLGLAVAMFGAVALVVVSRLAWTQHPVRVGVPLLLSALVVLLASPTFFPHYLGAVAVPAALVFGGAVERLLGSLAGRRAVPVALALVGCAALSVDLVGLSRIRSGETVPASRLTPVIQAATGCVTADDPNTLLALGVLGRNIARHCEVVIDLGGYSHDYARGTDIGRGSNAAWQRFCVRYLSSGELTIVTRFATGKAFDAQTRTTVRSWPVRDRSGDYVVRAPAG